MKILNYRTFLCLGSVLMVFSLQLNALHRQDIPFGLFEDEDILKISLSFDIATFMQDKPEEEYLPAIISIHNGGGHPVSREIKLRARGNYRRNNCAFPPVMLNFEDADTGYPDIDELEKVKLVSHCMDDDRYETYILREYLAYKIYNAVTEYSFRVRLLDVNYYDINYDTLYASRYGFILEPVDVLEVRFGQEELEGIEIEEAAVENDILLDVCVFQYLIGNSDWSVPLIHNLKVFGDISPGEKLITVPYDFDYSGWVNSHYAVALGNRGLEDITERTFLGPCRSRQEYRAVLDHYLGLEETIIDTIKEFKYLKGPERRDLIRYVKSFYKLYRKDAIIDIFLQPCNK